MSRALLIAAMALLVAWSTEASANLIVNGDFEAGLAPWTASGGVVIDTSQPNNGLNNANFFAIFPNSGTLQQTIPTAGTNFLLSFALNNGSSLFLDPDFSLVVTFDGNQVATFDSTSNFGSGYNPYTFSVSTLSSNTLLSFVGTTSDNGDWYLDDVSLNPVAVPEPSSVLILGGALALLFSLSFSIAPRLRITPKSDLM